MAQTLLIGLGGTGSRAVNKVVQKLHKNGKTINDGNICCAVLDTNKDDIALINGTHTGVPVVGTSKNQKIGDYFADYVHERILDWAPDSHQFREESMLGGAAEMRVKSRIAFMDCVYTRMINDIDVFINQALMLNNDTKIRVMLVSSLSGGTGSGMFIQVALWLRQRLAGAQIVMRGIFLLPDVFVNTITDIGNSTTKTMRHYANAYAAVRELNAISKIRQHGIIDLPEEIELDDLFRSSEGPKGKPVFDFAFFIDYKDENGVTLSGIQDYESAVADLVYMQMYAPMTHTMYSEEDNLFLESSRCPDPLYGSCGTSYAVYPVEDVLEFCRLRAVQESLTAGWRRIDDEIIALKAEAEERRKEGYSGSTTIDEQAKYIEIYERETAKREGGIRDPFFASIADEAFNKTKGNVVNGEVQYLYTDKVADLIKGITNANISSLVTSAAYNPARYIINANDFVVAEHTVEDLVKQVQSDKDGFDTILRNFERSREKHVDDIVSMVMSYTMTENMEGVKNTVMSLFAREEDGRTVFVHPVSARYMLLKLLRELKKTRERLNSVAVKAKVLADNDEESPKFDNDATKGETESSAIAYLESKKWYQREEGFTNAFEKEYAEFINAKVTYCVKYLTESLTEGVFERLETRLMELLKKFETLFDDLREVKTKVSEELAKVAPAGSCGNKNLIVYARPEHKEAVYKTLRIDLSGGRGINRSVILALYGNLCAQKRPNTESNQKYLNLSIVETFITDAKAVFSDMITEDPENFKKVNLTIYSAICKESDYGITANESETAKTQRHRAKFVECVRTLNRMAAPFLQYTSEAVDTRGRKRMIKKTTWGFHPTVVEEFSDLGTLLGINPATVQSDAYPTNELYCYRAVYNLKAELLPAFNELANGKYYRNYQTIIEDMLEMQNGELRDQALVQTPHLDKRWHNILPYITNSKEREDRLAFYRGFWLAVAYRSITIDKEGNFCVNKTVDAGFNSTFTKAEPVMFNEKPIASRDVVKLVEALKLDGSFASAEIPALEERFKNELEDISTYEGTDVLKGLKAAKADLNPIDMVVRYNRNKASEIKVLAALVAAMEEIAFDMANNYHDNSRSEKSIVVSQYKILRKIYDAAALTREKNEVFASWVQAFEELGIRPEGAASPLEGAEAPIE